MAYNVEAAWRGRRLTEARAGGKPAKSHKGFYGLHRLSCQTAPLPAVWTNFTYLIHCRFPSNGLVSMICCLFLTREITIILTDYKAEIRPCNFSLKIFAYFDFFMQRNSTFVFNVLMKFIAYEIKKQFNNMMTK
jgi:hypothetical protein